MSSAKGAASAAPNSSHRRTKPKRRRGPTVTTNPKAVAHDVEVLNWVRKHARSGLTTKDIVALSKTADEWPRPGKPLSDGSLGACFAAIYHLEAQGARWPLKSDSETLRYNRRQPRRVGKRLHEIRTNRATARRAGDSVVLWDTAYDITKLSGLLISLDIADIALDEHSLDIVNDLHDDMLFLQDWIEQTIGTVQGVLGEHSVREKIRALRAKTIDNGCTAQEAAAASRTADRLERKLQVKLVGAA